MKPKSICIVFIVSILLQSGLVYSQETLTIRSNTSGFSLGLGLSGQSWASDYLSYLSDEEPFGLGINLSAGYGFNQQFALIGGFGYHSFALNHDFWDSFELAHLDLGLRYNFGGTLQAFRPYVEGGIKRQAMVVGPINYSEYQLTGTNLQLGAGFNYFFNTRLALNVYGKFAFGKFSAVKESGFITGEQPDVFTGNYGIGINYVFSKY